ncbi:RNA polymerase sigma factor [Engelhardtia mirabilis]|uniref:ECF RNA polymerase sigma factor SigE n=1 Tax=Engelhardtia mirabilis TaxID=2528011 RepID=A0A518BF64_9BACT|nr:ECF RNA polymerase sigma factor SigE [Planctomycetes bacterium Pla133]QDU99949.1 ECF RNA polymerase sigma factor SigE [Planctomycetes bacterium Pla86]
MNDAGLRARELRDGAPDAIATWFELERPVVYRLCLGFLADSAEADDVTQDALLRLRDRIESWDPQRPYEPWRNTLVLNLCRDRIRRRTRREHHEQIAAGDTAAILPDPSDVAQAEELRTALAAALALLPPREREAFVLHDLEGMDSELVATQLEVKPATVRAMLCMARRRLRDALADRLPAGFAFGGGAL